MGDYKKQGGLGGGNNRSGGDWKKKDFGRGGFGGGRPDFKKFGGRDGGSAQMFIATCSECRKQCEVPFRPNGTKPVYCNDCFGNKRDDSPREYQKREFTPAFSVKPEANDRRLDDLKRQLDAVHVKLDKLMDMVGTKRSAPVVAAPEVKTEKKTEKPVAVPKKAEKKIAKKAASKKKPAKK